MQLVVSLALGTGLAAAAGLRLFVPLLAVSLGTRLGWLRLSEGFTWLGSPWVTTVLAIALLVEIMTYLVPWLDHLLDTLALPLASAAGILLAASVLIDVDPALRWILAVIAGGTTATVVQAGSMAGRAGSTATTGGLGNPVYTLAETLMSAITTVLALTLPLLVLLLVVIVVWLSLRQLRRRRSMQGIA
jgi:hypothetical protein